MCSYAGEPDEYKSKVDPNKELSAEKEEEGWEALFDEDNEVESNFDTWIYFSGLICLYIAYLFTKRYARK